MKVILHIRCDTLCTTDEMMTIVDLARQCIQGTDVIALNGDIVRVECDDPETCIRVMTPEQVLLEVAKHRCYFRVAYYAEPKVIAAPSSAGAPHQLCEKYTQFKICNANLDEINKTIDEGLYPVLIEEEHIIRNLDIPCLWALENPLDAVNCTPSIDVSVLSLADLWKLSPWPQFRRSLPTFL